MPTPGANLQYGNTSFLWQTFLRKLGLKPRARQTFQSTALKNLAADPGTTFPRPIGICAKFSTTTAPTSNTAADAPTGIGDICVYFAADNSGVAHINPTNITIYRCTAYTNTTTFTWTSIVT